MRKHLQTTFIASCFFIVAFFPCTMPAQLLEFESIVEIEAFDPSSADSDSQATGVNEAGQISGHSVIGEGPDRYYRAFLYDNGVVQNLGGLFANQSSFGEGLNNNGTVIGTSSRRGTSTQTNENFGVLFGLNTSPRAIGINLSPRGVNDNGDVVGESNSQGFLYDGTDTTFVQVAGSSSTTLEAINNSGVATGYASFASSPRIAFLYENGVVTEIAQDSFAFDINESNQVVGWDLALGEGFLYDDGTITHLGFLTIGRSINENGEIVGLANPATSVFTAGYHRNGVSIDLNDILPADSGWVLQDATGINSSGLIVGNGFFNGERRGFALQVTSVPEPGVTFAGLLLFGALATRRKRIA